MSWASLVGQPLAVRLLRQAVAGGKAAHAYLFVGPAGVGKRTIAIELAKALNCTNPSVEGGACDGCPSCRRFSAIHPDLTVIQPEGRFIKTDQVREMQGEMYARPSVGRVRVAIIDGADQMNPESGNRVLKLLEEPPPFAVLVLTAENLSAVLPTIISRCQVVHFAPLPPDQTAGALERIAGLDPYQARLYAALSGGSIGRAVAMAGDPSFAEQRSDAYTMLHDLTVVDDFTLLSRADGLEKQKDQVEGYLEMVTVWLRDAVLWAQTGREDLIVSSDRMAGVRDLVDSFGVAKLLAMVEAVSDTTSHLRRNVNLRLVLDLWLLRMADIARA